MKNYDGIQLDDAVGIVMNMLEKTDFYETYVRLNDEIKENDELLQLTKQFKELNKRYQMDKINGKPIAFSDERHISSIYRQITLNETLNQYFKAEKELALFLHGLFCEVREKTELSVDFLV